MSSTFLLNTATGIAASFEMQEYLIGTLAAGQHLCVKLQKECAVDKCRFLRPIPRRKVHNFACESMKMKPVATRESKAESMRNAFVHMLIVISMQTTFNLRHVWAYPVTSYPLAITQLDRLDIKTDKSKLLKKPEKLQDGFRESPIPGIDGMLIDGSHLTHSFLSAMKRITS